MRNTLRVHVLVPFMIDFTASSTCWAYLRPRLLGRNSYHQQRQQRGLYALSSSPVRHSSIFLDQVETSVARVLAKYGNVDTDILDLPPKNGNPLALLEPCRRVLQALTRNRDCRRCWLQQKALRLQPMSTARS
jgi:hypothetical protein